MKLANITASTPDPKDGQIQRDAKGEPTGILFENAMQLIEDIVPAPSIEESGSCDTKGSVHFVEDGTDRRS